MDDYIVQNIGVLTLAPVVFDLSYKLTGVGGASRRGFKSYLACLCVTCALAAAFAEINGPPAGARRQANEWDGQVAGRNAPARSWEAKSDYIRKVFYVSLAPALIGVYCGRRSGRRGKLSGALPRGGRPRYGDRSPHLAP